MLKPKKKRAGELFEYSVPELKQMLDRAVSIDNSSGYNLEQELLEHTKAHNDWSFLEGKAKELLDIEELNLKVKTAEVIHKIRRQHAEDGKPLAQTYPIEKELVPLDPEWQAAMKKVIDMRHYVSVLIGVDRKFNNRAWLLIQLAKRREGEFEPTVKGKRRGQGKPIETEEYEL
jgi:hypothetical protein